MVAPADTGLGAAPAPPDPDRRRTGLAGLGVAALSFLGGLVAASLVGATYAAVRGLDPTEATDDLGFALVTSAGLWLGFLVLPLLWARGHGGPARHLGLAARWVDLPLGLAVGLASTVVTAVISSAALTRSQQETLESKAGEVVERAQGAAAVVLLVLSLCVLTPLAEEVFFRGLFFGSLRRMMNPWVAVLAGGLAFGPVHFSGGPGRVVAVQIGLLGLFGVALCALAQRTGRLGASIVAHATFNTVTVVSLLVGR